MNDNAIFATKNIFTMKFLMVLSCFFLISGCTSLNQPFISSVNGFSKNEKIEKKKFILLSGIKNTSSDDLQFIEFSNYVKKSLLKQGFKPVDKIKDSDIIIFLAYSIGDPKNYQYSYSIPTWGQTGVSSSSTYGTVNSNGQYSSTTFYTPSYGVTGTTTHTSSSTYYTRFLSLHAFDTETFFKENRLTLEWKTEVVSIGSSGDLRLVAPYMIASMTPYIGKSTRQLIEVKLQEDDPSVQTLLSNLP